MSNEPQLTPSPTTQGIFPPRSAAGMPAIGEVAPLARPWPAIFAVAAVFIALIALFIAYFLDVRYVAQTKRDTAKAESVRTALQDPSLVETEQQVTQYATAIAGYQIASARQYDYAKLLTEIDQRLPKDALLDSITINEKGIVRLTGRATSFEVAAKAHESYKASAMLKNVALADVSLGSNRSTQQINFTISGTAQLATPDQTADQTATEGEGL